MATKTNTTHTKVKTIKAKALSDEFGRRRNNKTRSEKVRTKAYYLAALSSEDRKVLEAGGTVTKTYKSGRVESYVLG
jgi:hypothetical protein